jgi:hypothetical protein
VRTAAAALLLLSSLAVPAAEPVFDQPATAAQLEKDLAAVTVTLRQARTLRGAYTQTRRLRDIPKPLVSQGRFLFARDLGIVWRTATPFPSDLVITRQAIVQRDGEATTRLSADQQPAVRAVAAVFFAVFALEFRELEALFELFSRQTTAGWELGLRPRGPQGASPTIVVRGRTHVDSLTLLDPAGDLTEIRLREVAASPEGPTADERQSFSL